MKHITLTICTASLLFFSCNNSGDAEKAKTDSAAITATEVKKDAAPAAMPDSAAMAAMMKAWVDFKTPGDMHKWMAKHAGTWEGEVSNWMDPAAPPAKSMAKEVVKMSMNGLYQVTDFSGTMMGEPMMGHSIMGYDKMKKMFVLSWIDNLGSGIVNMSGTYDEATKTLNMKGTQSDPGQGRETGIRQELKWLDEDSYVMTMYGDGHDGKEQKFMEGTFKRKK